jgi:hypothetical protein
MRGRNSIGVSSCDICCRDSGVTGVASVSNVSFVEKRFCGNKTTSSLSFTPFSNPGHLDRISALEFDFPGI